MYAEKVSAARAGKESGVEPFRILPRGIKIPENFVTSDRVISVAVDDHRIWSFRVGDAEQWGEVIDGLVEWPDALAERLDGVGEFTLTDAVSGKLLYQVSKRFGRLTTPIDFSDATGRKLSLGKWGRLAPSFEGSHDGTLDLLLQKTTTMISQLEQLGYPTFIVGGTLLGAIRSGEFLPNDDDADLAYLSEYSHPTELAAESFRMEHQLNELGYFVVRHSAAHLQVTFLASEGLTNFYIDIFTAFFKDGEFCEPIHVRSDAVTRDDILPFSTATLAGVELPAPANPGAWLESCYGPHWLVPDPSFTFVTPRSTKRRFHGWFGSENRGRVLWNQFYADAALDPGRVSTSHSSAAERFAALLVPGSLIVDVGCGFGLDAIYFASLGHTVIAIDYSWNALDLAREAAKEERVAVDFQMINLYSRREVIKFSISLAATDREVNFYARHSLAGMTNSARFNAMMVAHQHLGRGGIAYTTEYAELAHNYSPDAADTWHLPFEVQREAAEANRLHIEQVHSLMVDERLVIETVMKKKESQA